MSDSIQQRKLFIGGLNIKTTQATLHKYFSSFGKVEDCVLMHNRFTGKSRCFGFVTMRARRGAEAILATARHLVDDKYIDCKWSVPQDSPELAPIHRSKKVFVGGIPYSVSKEDFREYFKQFGELEDCIIMLDKTTGNPRGFGFVTFMSEHAAEKVLDNYDSHYIAGKWVEVKIATPKESISTNDSDSRASSFSDEELFLYSKSSLSEPEVDKEM